jgi:GNAT superfamily N-acetyltransferase
VERDAEEMAALFRRTFASYPFPLHYTAFVRESITSGSTVYYAVVHLSNAQVRALPEFHLRVPRLIAGGRGQIVAVAGLEIDDENKNVEMSDFATHEEYQGKGFASFLLALMDVCLLPLVQLLLLLLEMIDLYLLDSRRRPRGAG